MPYGTLKTEEIGGAVARFSFSFRGRRLRRGDVLSATEMKSIPAVNRQALIDAHYLDAFPVIRAAEGTSSGEPTETHVVSRGFGRFDVIEGRKINPSPLSKEQAEALAAANNPAVDPPSPTITKN